MPDHRLRIPTDARTSVVRYRVPFYDTDAMAIVHHANYVRYLELARVRFLHEHDQPYLRYVEQGFHVVVTRVDIRLRTPTRFDEELTVTGWLERVRNVSLTFGYQIACGERLTATAVTEHGVVDMQGNVARIPNEHKARLLSLVVPAR